MFLTFCDSLLVNLVYAYCFSDDDDEDKIIWNVDCHYAKAEIDGCIINLEDCVYIRVNIFNLMRNLRNEHFFSYIPFLMQHC